MRTIISSMLNSEKGATALEYAVIGSLVSIIIVGGVATMGSKLNAMFHSVSLAF